VTGKKPCQLHVVARPWAIVNERWKVSNDMAAWNDEMICRGPRTVEFGVGAEERDNQLLVGLACLVCATVVCTPRLVAQNRPPATPLIAHNPYFSVWSTTDKLSDSPTRHWTGHPQPQMGLVRARRYKMASKVLVTVTSV